jgi:Transmembrane domain of unknown function (DUF3566)
MARRAFGNRIAADPVLDGPGGRAAIGGVRTDGLRTDGLRTEGGRTEGRGRPVGATEASAPSHRVVQGRRVRRVVRRIDAWSVFKLSLLFYLCICLVLLIAGVILWNVASAFNVIHNVEKFIKSLFDLQTFKFQPSAILEASVLGSALLVVLGTGANVLAAVFYNLMADVIGGVQVIVLEETEDA